MKPLQIICSKFYSKKIILDDMIFIIINSLKTYSNVFRYDLINDI